MAKYYKNSSSSTAVNSNMEREGEDNVAEMSEFDRHRETLLMDDAKEGWASELRPILAQCNMMLKRTQILLNGGRYKFFI